MRSKFKWIFTLLVAFFIQFSYAQEKTITGVVTESGLPLPGATVLVKGTSRGVSTDFDGKYSIQAKVGEVLEFSFVGMKTQSITVGASSTVSVTMESDTTLDEVVVVAYGTQKKESLTGSVAEIKAEEVSKITTSNVTQGLVGKIAGVQVANNTGMPGDGGVIRIRGIGSLNAPTPPLYVVDGVPFYGNINSINTQDIESMTILKDASAAALYGSRGSGGVVILTTKKGKNKKSTVTLESRAGVSSRAVKDYDFIKDQGAYYEAYYQGIKNSYMFNGGQDSVTAAQNAANDLINGGQGLRYNAYVGVADNQVVDPVTGRAADGALKYNEDWSDYLFGDGFFTQTNLGISGGNENTTHYFSLGYEKNDGYVVNSGFEKITTRLKLDAKINETFKVGANVGYAHTNQKYLDGYTGGNTYSSPFYWVRAVAPIYPVMAYDFDGNPVLNQSGQHLYDDGQGSGGLSPIRPFGSFQNPYATAIYDYKRRMRDNLFATGYVDVKIADGLVFTYNLSGELTTGQNWSMDTKFYGDAVNAGGRVNNSSFRQMSFTNQQLLKYNKRFGNHGFDVLLGHESLNRVYDFVYAERSNLLFDSPYVDHGAVYQDNQGGGDDYALESFLGRFAYDYDSKYYVNLSARRDGSSRFHPDVRWGNFYGAGVAWRVSQESFLKDSSWLNEFKLKTSIGQQGFDNLTDEDQNIYVAPYLTPFSITATNDTSLPISWSPVSYQGNPDIKWETSINFNAGFDAALFNNRLNIEAEYFKREVKDMLFNRPTSVALTGFAYRPENIGDMYNEGFELTLSSDVIRTDKLLVSLNLNATTYKNVITKLPQEEIITGNYIREVGGGAYDYYMREFAGVNPATGAALFWKYIDEDDHSAGRELTENHGEASLTRLGKSALPDLFGGFGFAVAYKGFDLGVDFAYQLGGYSTDNVWLSGLDVAPGGGIHSDFYNTWTPENPNASLPRIDIDDPNQYYNGSSLSLIKSDYLSIQNISAGYTFNSSITERLGLNKLRIYGLTDNVHLWSKRQGFDPRQSGVTGVSGNTYSLLRTLSFGINLEF